MENTTLAFIGMWEAVIIMVAILIFFGAKKLPELAAGLGKGIREFKKASSDFGDEIHRPYTPPQPRIDAQTTASATVEAGKEAAKPADTGTTPASKA
ncbi:MAG: twin-arginine translocase TatA/TatE family subunit [Pedosphaera sp.]|nr:twin-arginine translocase TatA/TatE family subunit [Pedosphaera sp.]MSU42563.1 twin-arginine translocase TatA/TatE family subunit [Pedosphaera sp.]